MVARNERAACYAPFEPQQFDGASGGDRRFDLVELQRPEASEFSSSGVNAVVPASLRKGGETVGTFAGEQQPDGLGRGLRGEYASGRLAAHLESKRAHRAGQEASRRESLGGSSGPPPSTGQFCGYSRWAPTWCRAHPPVYRKPSLNYQNYLSPVTLDWGKSLLV